MLSREQLNLAVLSLKESDDLAQLTNKWWYDRSECTNADKQASYRVVLVSLLIFLPSFFFCFNQRCGVFCLFVCFFHLLPLLLLCGSIDSQSTPDILLKSIHIDISPSLMQRQNIELFVLSRLGRFFNFSIATPKKKGIREADFCF